MVLPAGISQVFTTQTFPRHYHTVKATPQTSLCCPAAATRLGQLSSGGVRDLLFPPQLCELHCMARGGLQFDWATQPGGPDTNSAACFPAESPSHTGSCLVQTLFSVLSQTQVPWIWFYSLLTDNGLPHYAAA